MLCLKKLRPIINFEFIWANINWNWSVPNQNIKSTTQKGVHEETFVDKRWKQSKKFFFFMEIIG